MAIDQQTEDRLIAAVRAVAAREIMPRFRALDGADITSKAHADDLVTVADRAAEAALAVEIAAILPQALFIGEESVHDDPGLLDRMAGAELAVVLDPIDGTGNYAAGLTIFGVILAVVARGETVFGLLYDPVIDDWVMARKGGGAWFARPGAAPRRLRGRAPRPRHEAQGYLPLFLYRSRNHAEIAAGLAEMGRTSTLRCSCHEYRQVALGHVDFALQPTAKPWDHAAGCLVVTEAGGLILSGGTPGYDPLRPEAPVVAIANAESGADLLPPAFLTL